MGDLGVMQPTASAHDEEALPGGDLEVQVPRQHPRWTEWGFDMEMHGLDRVGAGNSRLLDPVVDVDEAPRLHGYHRLLELVQPASQVARGSV